jgi:hypothetical protein
LETLEYRTSIARAVSEREFGMNGGTTNPVRVEDVSPERHSKSLRTEAVWV